MPEPAVATEPAPETVTKGVTPADVVEEPSPASAPAETEPSPAPEKPTPASEPSSPEAAEEAPSGDERWLSRREARRRARDRSREATEALTGEEAEDVPSEPEPATDLSPEDAAARAEDTGEPVIDRNGRKHDPKTGEFLPEDGEEQAEQEAAVEDGGEEAEVEAAEGRTTDEVTEQAESEAADERPERVRVDLPPGHALRGMGVETIEALPEQEQAVRALINGYERRAAVEDLSTKLDEAEQELVKLRSRQSATERWKQTDEYQGYVQRFHKLKELEQVGEVPDGTASTFWKGIQPELQELVDEEYEQEWGKVEARRREEAGRAWTKEAFDRTRRIPHEVRNLPQFQNWFTAEVDAFNWALEQGHYPNLTGPDEMHQEFQKRLNARLMQEKPVRKVFRRMTEAQKAEGAPEPSPNPTPAPDSGDEESPEDAGKKAVEDYKRKAAQKRKDAPPHPMGRVAGAERSDHRSVDPAGNKPDPSQGSVHDVRKRSRKSARSKARQHFG